MPTNINFDKKLGISRGTSITLPTASGFADTQSLLYDGIDDYQDTSAWSTIDGSTHFTISFWLKLNSMSTTSRVLFGYESGTNVNLYIMVLATGRVDVWSGGNSSNWTRGAVGGITLNNWHHIVMRLDRSTGSRYTMQKIFIDGVQSVGSSNYFGGTIPNGTTLGVGANYNYSHPAWFQPTSGNINELAIWGSNALTDAQILEVYNSGSANDLTALPTAPSPTNWYRSENANWLGSYYETADEMGNGAKLMSRNMAEASRVNDVPPNVWSNTLSTTFDGIDDSVSMGNVLNLADDGTDAYSFSLWFKTTNSGVQQLIGKSATNGYNIYTISGAIYFGLGTYGGGGIWGRGAIGSGVYNGSWQHLVLTYDGSQDISGFTIYYNNLSYSTITTQNTTPIGVSTANHFMIGARGNTGTPSLEFDGNIDEASFFNSELSASDVATIYNSGAPNDISGMSGLVSFWRMGDNDTYPTITDVVGSNDGTMTNMTSANFVTDVPPNFNINSFLFDGVDDIFEGSTIYSEMNGGTKLTLSVWLKPISGVPTLEYVLSNPRDTTANNSQFALILYEGNSVQFNVQGFNSQYVSGNIGAITYGAWNHILICVDLSRTIGTEGIMFINGVDETTTSAMGTLSSSFYTATDVLHIGVDANGGYNRFNGNIDELSIWSGSDLRSASDVSSIYNSGVPSDLNDTSGIAVPTTYFRMGEQSTFGSQWSMTDINGSYAVTSSNMVLASRTTDIP